MDRRSLALASRHRHPPGPARPYEVASLGLRSIVAYTRSDNVASRGVMSKLAMTHEKASTSMASRTFCTASRSPRVEATGGGSSR